MGVRKYERKESELAVLNQMRWLTVTVLRALGNETLFPKRSRWLISGKIADECVDAQVCITRANSAQLGSDYRKQQQAEAKCHIDALERLLGTAYDLYQLPAEKIEYWGKLILGVKSSLSRWISSDKKRI